MVGKVSLSKLNEWSSLEGIGIILAPDAKFIPQNKTASEEAFVLA
jgi:hypothetical protein